MRIAGRKLRAANVGVEENEATRSNEPSALPYEPPTLVVLGDVRSLTLGGPSGAGDSPNPGLQFP